MKGNEFEKQMENLKTPQADTSSHQQILKMTLLNAKKFVSKTVSNKIKEP